MEGIARNQHGLGADHLDVLVRNIDGEVDGPGRQRELRDVGKFPRIGGGAWKAHQLDRRIAQRLLNGRGWRPADKEGCVDLAFFQR